MLSEATMKIVQATVNSQELLTAFNNLKARWADEHEYEDIADYGKVIAQLLPEGAHFVRMNKRPFAAVVTFDGDGRQVKLVLKNKPGGYCCLGFAV